MLSSTIDTPEVRETMDSAKILLVEDDYTIARFVQLELEHQGYEVIKVADGALALEAVEKESPNLLILDLMLPGVSGLEIAGKLRKQGNGIPILMLTALSDANDLVLGFDAGADDYLRKPFEISELLSRVRSLLKRTSSGGTAISVEASGVVLDLSSRRATIHGEPLDLTAREFDLLYHLVANAGRVISRDEIIANVWGGQHSMDSNVIEVFVCHLRGKIGDSNNTVIQTIRGVGYFFAKG